MIDSSVLGKDLLILEECTWSDPPKFSNPSWVPDWTQRDHFRLFGGEPIYNASLGLTPQISFTEYGQVLSCKGMYIGKVDGLGATYFETGRPTNAEDSLQQARNNLSPYGAQSGMNQAVWQTFVAGRTPTGKVAPESFKSILQCAPSKPDSYQGPHPWRGRATFDRVMEANSHLQICGRPLHSFFPPSPVEEENAADIRDAFERMFRCWRSKRLLVTSQGKIGLGAAAMRLDDEIFILPGCTVPVILRPTRPNGYRLVGCCYVHGYMEGELLSGPHEDCLLQNIDIY